MTAIDAKPPRAGRPSGRAAALFALLLAGLQPVPARAAPEAEAPPLPLQQAIGADRFRIGGSFRARYESYDHGFRPRAPASDDTLSLRTVIRAEYRGDGFRIGGELRDGRTYRAGPDTRLGTLDTNAMELVGAYAAVHLDRRTTLTGGRMILDIGSRRVVGEGGFPNATPAFTGLRLDWRGPEDDRLLAFFTLPQQRLPADREGMRRNRIVWDDESWDHRFWGVHYARPLGPMRVELYVYGLDEGHRPNRAISERHLVMPGVRFFAPHRPGRWDFDVESVWQGGRVRTTPLRDTPMLPVDAYMAHGEMGYSFAARWAPRLSVFADVASGDDAGTRSYNRYEPLYEARRIEWGPVALFAPLGRTNLRNLGVKLETRPGKRIDTYLAWRKLWLDSPTDSFSFTEVRDPTGRSGRDAGAMTEARLRYWLIPGQVQIDVTGAVLHDGPFMRRAPNATRRGDTRYGLVDMIFFF